MEREVVQVEIYRGAGGMSWVYYFGGGGMGCHMVRMVEGVGKMGSRVQQLSVRPAPSIRPSVRTRLDPSAPVQSVRPSVHLCVHGSLPDSLLSHQMVSDGSKKMCCFLTLGWDS